MLIIMFGIQLCELLMLLSNFWELFERWPPLGECGGATLIAFQVKQIDALVSCEYAAQNIIFWYRM